MSACIDASCGLPLYSYRFRTLVVRWHSFLLASRYGDPFFFFLEKGVREANVGLF